MKITKKNIDANLHEAADTLDHLLGEESSLDEPGVEEAEASTPAQSGGMGAVVAFIQKIPVFADVPEAIIVQAIAAISSLRGKSAEEILTLLQSNGGLKSQVMNKVGELADLADEEARNA
jgi:hypothetical protein